ncbi:hypothetical protein HON59_02855 [bacterium]|nr:hypothetical protein [bacterium]
MSGFPTTSSTGHTSNDVGLWNTHTKIKMKSLTFKKIIPILLITAVLFTGFFGVIGSNVAYADTADDLFKKADNLEGGVSNIKKTNSNDDFRSESKEKTTVGSSRSLPSESIIDSNTGCSGAGVFDGKFHLDKCINSIFAKIGNVVLKIFGFFLGIAGVILDKAVDYTIVGMGEHTEKIGMIEEGWKVFRDLSNIVIIFVLLVIGIATILRYQSYGAKALLRNLIIVALLINFSLFFTQVVIDSSNLISLQFYNKITVTEQDSNGQDIIRKVGERYMQAFGLTTIYDGTKIFEQDRLNGSNKFNEILLTTVLGSVMFLVATFAFLAGASLLIIRFVTLIFLMILAPLAFVGMILPALSKHSSKWLGALMRYAFFAPAYMVLTWFVIEVVNSNAFQGTIGLNNTSSFAAIAGGGSAAIIFNFIVVIAFIIGSILIANEFGIRGSAAVMKWGHSARKFGQGVVGRGIGAGGLYVPRRLGRYASLKAGVGAEKLQESNRLSARVLRHIPGVVEGAGALGAAGRATVKKREGLQKDMSKATLENKLGMKTTSIADKQAIAKTLFESEQGNLAKQVKLFTEDLAGDQRKEVYKGMTDTNRAAFEKELKSSGSSMDIARDLRPWLSAEQGQKTDDAKQKIIDKEMNRLLSAPATLLTKFTKLDYKEQEKFYKQLSERDRVEVDGILAKANQVRLNELKKALSPEQLSKTLKEEKELRGKKDADDLKAATAATAPGILTRMRAAGTIKYLEGEVGTLDNVFKNFEANDFREHTRNSKFTKEDKAFIKAEVLADPTLPASVRDFFTTGMGATMW